MLRYDQFLSETLADEVKSEPKTNASREARQLGLTYVGFGRYANDKGQVAYIVDNDRLIPYKSREEVQNSWNKTGSDKSEVAVYNKRQKADTKIVREKDKEIQALNSSLYNFYKPNMFDEEELNAISEYTADAYEYINSYLYKGHEKGTSADQDQYINRLITALDSSFEDAEAPFPYTVYSGLSSRYKPDKLKQGSEYIFRGYVSTSISFGVAIDSFSDSDWTDSPVVLQIEIDKGQKSIYVDPVFSNPGEGETLLPRGSKIQIMSGPHLIDDTIISNNPRGSKIHLFHCQLVEDV
jgi:hypothetical protein